MIISLPSKSGRDNESATDNPLLKPPHAKTFIVLESYDFLKLDAFIGNIILNHLETITTIIAKKTC